MAIYEYQKNGKTLYRAYVHARSVTHKVRVQRMQGGLATMAAARREESRLMKEVIEEISRIEGNGHKWTEIVDRWVIHTRNKRYGKSVSRESLNVLESLLRRYTSAWLEKRVGELNRADGRRVIDEAFSSGLSVARVQKVKAAINRVFTWGVEEGIITDVKTSPVYGLDLPKPESKMKPILTQDEIKLLMFEAYRREHPWRFIWAVAILTGMRSGELHAVKWSDIDLKNKIIRITKSWNPKLRGIKSTKNSDWRNGHISPDLENVLIELKNQREDEEFVLPHLTGWDGGYAGRILRDFLKSIGIEKYVNFHTLRACFATHVLASGAEPTQVMKMGGWADFKTFQIYVRMAGVDVKGVTDNFKVMPKVFEEENVVKIR